MINAIFTLMTINGEIDILSDKIISLRDLSSAEGKTMITTVDGKTHLVKETRDEIKNLFGQIM